MKKLCAALTFVLLLAVLAGCSSDSVTVNGRTYANDVTTLLLHNQELKNSDLKPLRKLTHVEFLTLGDNYISDVSPLTDLTTLEYIDLSDNEISSLKGFEKLINLTELNLSRNRLADVSVLKELPGLKILQLAGNQIDDIGALKEMTGLSRLELADNPLTDEQKEELWNALPDCEIWFANR